LGGRDARRWGAAIATTHRRGVAAHRTRSHDAALGHGCCRPTTDGRDDGARRKAVREETGGAVEIQTFPAGQLGSVARP
jgi:TRAP-type C4-dicarboxylate transport system substrate-binding protein